MLVPDQLAQLRHSLRTPLNHIIGYGEMLLEDGVDAIAGPEPASAELYREALDRVVAGGKELASLIHDRLAGSLVSPDSILELRREMTPSVSALLRSLKLPLAGAGDSGTTASDLWKINAALLELLRFCQTGVADTPGAEEAPAPVSLASPAGQGARILVVDDIAANREMLARQLERQGYQPVAVQDGPTALTLLRSSVAQPSQAIDVILLDILMPGMSGFQVLEVLQRDVALRHIPVIVISALDDMNGVIRSIEMGAEDFLPKPFDPVLLRARIGALLRRKRAEQERAELAGRFRLLLESTAEGIFGLELDGRCSFLNEAASRMLGYGRDELLGKDFHGIVYRSEPRPILQTQLSGRGVRITGVQFFRKDGSSFPVEYSARPIRKAAGQASITGVVVTFVDITERQHTEEQLREAAKLESLGVLAGGIAHDFNNLLTGILGNASLIQESLIERDPNRELLKDILTSSERAADLTRQMLAFAGKGNLVIRPVDCSKLISELDALIHSSMPRNVQVELSLAPGLSAVRADPNQLQQLLLNLIINAGEAIDPQRSGRVRIETGEKELSGGEIISGLTQQDLGPGRYVVLTVTDNGTGISHEIRKRMFDPFFTTKFTGRGLGLAAVSGIVRSHRGAIQVDSTPGQGTVVRVFLPVDCPAAETSKPVRQPKLDRSPESPTPGSPIRRILLAHGQDVIRRETETALQRLGYTVLVAADGQSAVELFRSEAEAISAVLLEDALPVLSGEEAARFMHTIRHTVPVILMTGSAENCATARFRAGSIAAVVPYPLTAEELERALRGTRR